jgi:hypothetical protein
MDRPPCVPDSKNQHPGCLRRPGCLFTTESTQWQFSVASVLSVYNKARAPQRRTGGLSDALTVQ